MPPVNKRPPAVRLITRGAPPPSEPELPAGAAPPPAGRRPAREPRPTSPVELDGSVMPGAARRRPAREPWPGSPVELDGSVMPGAARGRPARGPRRGSPVELDGSAMPGAARRAVPTRKGPRAGGRKPARAGRRGSLVPTEAALGWGLLYDLLCAPVWLFNLARGRAALRDGLRPLQRLLRFVLSARMTALLILLNLLVFAVELYARGAGWSRAAFIARFALSTDGLGRGEHLPLLTHFFAHVDLVHLGGNMLALFVFGRVVERNLGPWRLLGCYLLAAVCSTALSLLAQGLSGRSVPTLGASGAVAGLLALGILLEPLTITFEALVPMPLFLVGWLAIAADFAALLGRGGVAGAPGLVDHPAHLGGYLSVLLGYYVLKRQQRAQARLGLLINLLTLLLMAGLWLR